MIQSGYLQIIRWYWSIYKSTTHKKTGAR